MKEGKIVVGVDIGTSKVVTLIAKVDEDKNINILGVSETASVGIRKGQIVDIEEAVSSINKSLEAAERMAGYSVSNAVISIGGSHIECFNSKGVVAVANPQGEINQSDVERVIEAARAVSIPSSKEILHVLPRSYSVDGQEGIKDPTGMTGVRLEVETHIITASATALRNMEKALSEVGVSTKAFVFSGYASSLSILSDTEKELGVILIDIGAGTTDVSIYVEGAVSYSSVLPIGARHVTNDLAIGLRVSLESAEKIKLFLSRTPKPVSYFERNDEERKNSDELDLSRLGLSEDIKKVSRKTITEGIIRPRLNEIFEMVGSEIRKSGFGGQTPAGLVITGGGAKTVGISESAKRVLAMPVRIGYPTELKGIVEEVQNSSFATSVGLLRYDANVNTEEEGFNLSSFNLGKFLPFKKGSGPKAKNSASGGSGKMAKKAIDFIKSFLP